jgi:hypothetical protein
VEADIRATLPLARPGAAMAFHDYGQSLQVSGIPFGVTEAVDAFAAGRGAKVEVVEHLAVVRL